MKLDFKLLTSLFIFASLISFQAIAQESVVEEDEEDEEVVEEIVVTGSRIARDPNELAQPITIISGEEYRNRGYTNAAQALTDLPGVGTVNSLSGDQSGLSAGQQIAANFDLGSDRTLTLVNGRRFVGSQVPGSFVSAGSGNAVDLNNIPAALIDRVEVLPVGGAAVYGADAIAGVINFILKDDFEGAEFNVNQYDYAGMATDNQMNFTVGGNFADGRGNVVLNAQFESIDQVFYDQANDRLYNCESGFFFRNPADSGQQMYAVSGTVYPLALPESWHFGKANAQGQRSFGDNGGNLCPTLVSNPVEGLLTVYGYNEVGDPNCFGIPNYWCGALPDGNFYRFDGPGNLAIMDPGVPYGRYYYTRGSDIFDIQKNRVLRSGFERRNLTGFLNYDLNDSNRFYMDFFTNDYFAEDDGSSSSAHYSDYYFGAVDSDNCNAGGNCYSPLASIPIDFDDPFLTPNSRSILSANGFGTGDTLYMQRLWSDLAPTLRGDGFDNESNVQFYTTGFEGEFGLLGLDLEYDTGFSWGETRVISNEPFVVAARWAASLDYGINPNTGQIDCRFNYDPDYQLPATGLQDSDYSTLGGGVGLGSPGDCAPFNPMGFNNPDNAAAKEYFTGNTSYGGTINQQSYWGQVSGQLPAFFESQNFGGPIDFVLGFDNRKESAEYVSDPMAYFAVTIRGSAQQGSGGQYKVSSNFLEVSLPIIQDLPFAEEVRLDYGTRTLENSNVSRTNEYDVSATSLFWRVNSDFALRASDQTTTKSPNLLDLYGPRNPTFQQALDPCDARYSNDGDFPANRRANCIADGIDPDNFRSFVAGGTVQGSAGGNPNLLDEQGETTSFGLVFTPTYDFLEPFGNFSLAVDLIEIYLTDYVTTFSLQDFMEACYDAASFPNNFCLNFQRDGDGQVIDFQVGAGNSGVIDFGTYVYRLSWDHNVASMFGLRRDFGDVGLTWRGYQQTSRNQADSGDPADLVDRTGWASDPEWLWDLNASWAFNNVYAYYQVNYVDGGWINKSQTDTREDYYLGVNGQVINQFDSYWTDLVGVAYNFDDRLSFTVRVNNPLDHDGSESRYQTERGLNFVGRTVTTSFTYRF
tara:strand:+ start:3747 stop:7010 length:3264 start_codon:yes stop_codon:yes gene_type:complete